MRRFCGRDSWQGQGVMDHLSQRSHRGRLRKDLSKLCKMFPDSMRFGIRTIFCKTICNNNLHQWHRVGNGPCLFQCAKDGVSSVLAGQGKRRGRATQGLRSYLREQIFRPVPKLQLAPRWKNREKRTFSPQQDVPWARGVLLWGISGTPLPRLSTSTQDRISTRTVPKQRKFEVGELLRTSAVSVLYGSIFV